MRLINSSVEIIPQESGLLGIYKQIEIGGRTAYKSEDRITPDSAQKFVDMLIQRGHTAPLEQGTVYLKIKATPTNLHIDDYLENKYSKVNLGEDDYAYITTNARVIYENNWQSDLKYICEPSKYHEKRISVRFTCSRAIANELVRHRTFSFVQESSRYCNYNKDKFGNEITYIIPSWANLEEGEYKNLHYRSDIDRSIITVNGKDLYFRDDLDNKTYNFLNSLHEAELSYLFMINYRELTPQFARDVLPLATKTEVVMTGFESDWEQFFKLRCDSAAHPDMQKLANELKEKISAQQNK